MAFSVQARFFGLYRGLVKENDDSNEEHPHLCRLRVLVPQIYGPKIKTDDLPWAYPVLIGAGGQPDGKSYGLVDIPPVESSVWVMFEYGDPTRPVWLGGWYGEKDAEPETPEAVIEDSRSGEVYPDIKIWKNDAFDDGMWVRMIGDSRFEFCFDGEHYLEFDRIGPPPVVKLKSGSWKILIEADEEDIEIHATAGKITLRADADDVEIQGTNITIQAEENLTLQAGSRITLQGASIREQANSIYVVGGQGSIRLGANYLHRHTLP